ncbi:MAG: ribosome maturation factor RimM [Gammaproteobacteria bacterium]|jgi:16S rRNA processing protein RimM
MEDPDSQLVVVGKITSAYGIKGWVKIYSYTDPVTNILNYNPWYLPSRPTAEDWQPRQVLQGRAHGKHVVAQLENVSDRHQAELLRGLDIAIPRNELPPAAEGEYYWIDLKGLKVVNTNGLELGVIEDIMETGANDVLVVAGDRQRLIPYVVDDVVKHVDLQSGTMTVDWEPDY